MNIKKLIAVSLSAFASVTCYTSKAMDSTCCLCKKNDAETIVYKHSFHNECLNSYLNNTFFCQKCKDNMCVFCMARINDDNFAKCNKCEAKYHLACAWGVYNNKYPCSPCQRNWMPVSHPAQHDLNVCVVCLEGFNQQEDKIFIDRNPHPFHAKCIRNWFNSTLKCGSICSLCESHIKGDSKKCNKCERVFHPVCKGDQDPCVLCSEQVKPEQNSIDRNKKQCPICFEFVDLKNTNLGSTNRTIFTEDCLTPFHGNCLKTWLENKNMCPMCKRQLSNEFLNALGVVKKEDNDDKIYDDEIINE